MNLYRNSLSSFKIDVVDDSSFKLNTQGTIKGNGFDVKSSSYFTFDQLGTCEIPYDLKLPQ